MSIFKNLFSGKASVKSTVNHTPEQATVSPTKPIEQPDMIRVFDNYDREGFITREQWRDNVLQETIEKTWDDPENLAAFIIQSLENNFFDEMIEPAERLLQLEPNSDRGATLLAFVYLKVKRLEDSENVLRQYIDKNGESGVVMTHLAKIHAERGHDKKVLETLWHGLQLDPNQENGLGWYEAIHRKDGGEASGLEALHKVAAIPGSWRSQLWLAQSELKKMNLEGALALYRDAQVQAGKPVPTDLLMQMSGDLGNAGYLSEILRLIEPQFEPSVHGLQVGNNLIKAHFDLRQFDDAHRILNNLYSLKRPDWKATLGYWDRELAKANIGEGKVIDKSPMCIRMLVGNGPIWLEPESPAAELFKVEKANKLTISFLGCSAELPNYHQHIGHQLSDASSHMSRAIPLFLAEQLELHCGVDTQTLVPWTDEPSCNIVLRGVAWTDQEAVRFALESEAKTDYVVVSHIITKIDPWIADFRLVSTVDSKRVGQLSASFQIADPAQAIKQLSQELIELFSRSALVRNDAEPNNYSLPENQYFPHYLLCLDQLLAVRCCSLQSTKTGILGGERKIIDGNLQLALHMPSSINIRLLLAETVLAMKNVRPDILPEFSERIALLQKEEPLTEPAQNIVKSIFDEAFVA